MSKNATRAFLLNPFAFVMALAAPGAALAEALFVSLMPDADMRRHDSNYIELGAGYNDSDSYKLGEYTGLAKAGGFLIGNFNARKRYGDRDYLNAYGYNLGLDSRQLFAEYGAQGRYWVNGSFDQLTRNQYDDTQFIHGGLGSNSLSLASACGGFAQPNNAAGQAIINPCLQTFKIKQKRDVFKLGGGLFSGTDWKFTFDYREDKQEGNRLIGSVVGNSGGNPRAVIVPYDRDSRTRQFEASAIWATKKAQANISFWYSKYDNASESMTWQNPYAAPGAWPPVSGFPTGSGRLGLAPENDFWQLKGTGAWNLDRKNRLTGTLSYSIMKRDGAFLPYTVNAIPTPTPLPRASLDGEIKNTLFDLSWITRPMPKVSLKLNYHYTHQDNKTPQDWYSYIGGDASTQTVIPPGTDPNTVVSGRVRRNLPPGKEENRFKIDGDYAIARGTLLRAWYQYKKIDYEEASERLRSDTDNNELGVELRRTMSAEFTGWLRYVHDKRRGSDFSTDRPYQAGYSNGYVFAPFVPPAGGNRVDNIPTLRQSFVADYDKDLLTVFGNYNPADRVSLGLRGDWHSKKYKGPDCGGPSDQLVAGTGFIFPPECLGRQKTEGSALTLDGSYTPADGWNTFAFYTYQTYKTEQTGRAFSGTGTELAQATDPTRNWSHTIKQEDDTLGMGVRYRPSDKRWDAGAQYVYTQGRGKYNSVAGTSLPEFPGDGAPDTVSKVNSLQLFGTYKHSKSVLFRFNYWYEKLKSDDWAYDFATPTSSSNVVLTGHQAPKYENHVIGVSVAFTNF